MRAVKVRRAAAMAGLLAIGAVGCGSQAQGPETLIAERATSSTGVPAPTPTSVRPVTATTATTGVTVTARATVPPAPTRPTTPPTTSATVPTTQPARRVPTTVATAPPSGGTYFANCTEARVAGAAPIRVGQPGYRPALDRDADGIACEV